MDSEADPRNFHQLLERNRRGAAVSHGFNGQFDFAVVTFVTAAFGAGRFSIPAKFEGTEVIDNSHVAFAKDLEMFLGNRLIPIRHIGDIGY